MASLAGRRGWTAATHLLQRVARPTTTTTAPAARCMSTITDSMIAVEEKYGAHNYHPLPVVLSRGKGVHVWDVEGKQYFDFLSAYSAVNHGHGHPRLLKALEDQASKIALTSRAFHNEVFGSYAKMVNTVFGYDKMLPMNTGVEAVETAVKLCRRWGYDVKKVPANEAVILFAKDNFHGRSLTAITASTDPSSYTGFGPFVPNIDNVPFNDTEALAAKMKEYGGRVVAFIVEPIQGEAGVVTPDDGYLQQCKDICHANGALFVADEVQTGLCRTGDMLAVDHEGVRPDVVILGKALAGGLVPASAVLADDEVMLTIKPGEHGSTFGGNPLASAVAMESLQIMLDDGYAANAARQGRRFRGALRSLIGTVPQLKLVRGRGLLNAIEIEPQGDRNAWTLCMNMKEAGLLAKPTHGNIVRFAPPLVINNDQMDTCIDIIAQELLAL